MKKIGIITIVDYLNYGNRLQNYATQEVLKSLGFQVETIRNKIIKKNRFASILNLRRRSLGEISTIINNKIKNLIYRNKIKQYNNKKMENFRCFSNKYILETEYIISEDNMPTDLSDRFDYFITGSDQVWNPFFRHCSSIDFLAFAPQNKRIAYAPSFGISEIPPEYVDKYKVWLSGIFRLSVREKQGANIIKELTGRNAVVLVDPTLMLSRDKWLSIAKKAFNKPAKKYILTYFLGEIPKETIVRIKQIAAKNNLDIVNLADIKDVRTYITGPSEFIDYINSASVLFTDSFHGCVFSILMETPFVVFDRKGSSMYSRIDTLLSKFKLESRKAENIKSDDQIFESDYSHIPTILEAERKKALDYLKEALQVRDDC